MKRFFFLVSLLVLLPGCGTLLPKKVEFFQKKVQAVPEVSEKMKETQRQAADYVARKTKETELAAIATDSAQTVTTPATEAATVAEALSDSMGPPEDPWKKEAARLAALLQAQEAKFNAKLETYRQRTEKLEGKAIEGTGLVRVGYFTMWGIGLFAVFAIFLGLKLYGMVNPVVGLGVNAAGRVSSAVLKRAIGEISRGGEAFKEYLARTDGLDDKARDLVLDLFSRAQLEEQSKDVQSIIGALTKK